MTPDQLLDRLAAVRIDRSHGGRAPHKPLMLLLALARVGLGPESRLIPYQTADERFKELWEDFGRPGAPPRVHYPFGRLRNDDRLWEILEESQGIERGREQGIAQGREQGQVAVLVQLIARKFGQGTAEEVRLIAGSPGRDRIAWVSAAILDCDAPRGVHRAPAGRLKGILSRWRHGLTTPSRPPALPSSTSTAAQTGARRTVASFSSPPSP